MSSRKTSQQNVVVTEPDENDINDIPPEEQEGQQVNLGEIGNYFDVVRNNYFEAQRVIFLVGHISWEMGIHIIQKLSFYDDGTKKPITILHNRRGITDKALSESDKIIVNASSLHAR
jgi:hypothetical protein